MHQPLSLQYFYISSPQKNEKLYPNPIEDKTVKLEKVTINGKNWSDFNREEGYVNLPESQNVKMKVILSRFEQKRVLVYTKNGEGYVHENISASVKAIKKICNEKGIAVDVTDKPSIFTDEKLKN